MFLGMGFGARAQQNKADSLEKLLSKKLTDTVRVNVLNELAFAIYPINPEKSKEYSSEALKSSEKLNYTKGIGYAYVNMGLYFRQKGEFEQAFESLSKALEILEPTSEIEARGNAYITLGLINAQQGNFAKSHQNHLKALKLYENANNKEKIAVCLANIGSTYLFQEEYTLALQYYFKSLPVSQSVNDQWREANCYGNIAWAYSRKGNYDTALIYFDKYLVLAKEIKQPTGRVLIVIGETYLEKKEYPQALEVLRESFASLEKSKNKYYVAEVCNALGKTYLGLNRSDSALFFYKKALFYAQAVGAKALVSKSYEGVSKVYQKQNKIDSAYKYLDLFIQLKDSVYKEETLRKMNFAQFTHDLEKKQTEITILQEQNSKEVIARNLIIVVVVLLLSGTVLLFINRNKIKKKNNLLYLQNIEIKEKTEEILTKNNEILVQNEELQQQKEEIMSQRDNISVKNEELQHQKEKIEEASRSMGIISEIGQQITATLNLEKAVMILYQYINEIMSVDELGIGTYDPQSQKISYEYYIYKGEREPFFELSIEHERFSTWVIRHQKSLFLGNVHAEYTTYIKNLDSYSADRPFHSIICLPLMISERVLGVVSIRSADKYAYNEYHLDVLQALASYISIALENTSSYQLLKEANKNITDSIRYAQDIQQAILPPEEEIKAFFSEYFIVYSPKDIVSGDFYWLTRSQNKTFVAVVDCTGHGVPGAFMSMIGNTLLNEIVNIENITETNEVLSQLDQKIRLALQQDSRRNQDGMDLSICSIEAMNDGFQIIFSGAKSNLIYIQHGKSYKIKGDSKTIGGIHKEKKLTFTKHQRFLPAESLLYLYSDGFIDQADPEGNRIGSTQFEAWIKEVYVRDLPLQKEFFLDKLRQHQKDVRQRDDITLLGLKL